MSFSAHPSVTVNSSDTFSSSHGSYKEGAAIGVPVSILSVIIILLVALLIRYRRRTQSTMANLLDRLANNKSNTENAVEQQIAEAPAGIAAAEMEARPERRELAA